MRNIQNILLPYSISRKRCLGIHYSVKFQFNGLIVRMECTLNLSAFTCEMCLKTHKNTHT